MIGVILLTTFLATVLFLFLYLFSKIDCDINLLIAEKFGTKPRALKNKVIWLTGASSGIGEALAYVLATVGSKLVLSGTNVQNLDKVRKKCLALNPTLKEDDVFILIFNMKDIDAHAEKLKQVLERFQKIDILVNNAGKSQRSSFEDVELEVHKELFEINVFGLINLTRLVVKHWYATNFKGHLVVTSSITGKLGAPYSTSYTASKHALHGYFEAIRLESFCKGLTVTMICPGPVFSAILQNAVKGKLGEAVGGQAYSDDSKRMSAERCAYLMTVAIANKVDETWIAEQPFLTIFYTTQYLPSLTRQFLCRYLTKERASQLRDGN